MCRFISPRAFTGSGVDLTLIDEERGDNITSGTDIFNVSNTGITLHFKGAGSGGTITQAYSYVVDTPNHVGTSESIEGVGDCPSEPVGCT